MTIYSRFVKLTSEIGRSEMVAITNHLRLKVYPWTVWSRPCFVVPKNRRMILLQNILRLLMNPGVRNLTEPLRSSFKSLGVIDGERNNRKPISDSGRAQLFLPGCHFFRFRLTLFGAKIMKPSSMRLNLLVATFN